jgi:hypothetical protein
MSVIVFFVVALVNFVMLPIKWVPLLVSCGIFDLQWRKKLILENSQNVILFWWDDVYYVLYGVTHIPYIIIDQCCLEQIHIKQKYAWHCRILVSLWNSWVKGVEKCIFTHVRFTRWYCNWNGTLQLLSKHLNWIISLYHSRWNLHIDKSHSTIAVMANHVFM